jgi:YfiH family protein
MKEFSAGGVTLLQADLLLKEARILHGFSTRRGGVSSPPYDSLNFSSASGDSPENVERNFAHLCRACAFSADQMRLVKQVHGNQVLVVTRSHSRAIPPEEADALVTHEPGLVLGIKTADCLPLLLYDPVQGVIAAIHAGWRGLLAGVIQQTLRVMKKNFLSSSATAIGVIGAGIEQKSFEVGPEVRVLFLQQNPLWEGFFLAKGEKFLLDLKGVARQILCDEGFVAEKIETLGVCTYERRDLLYSHRRDGARTGRQLNFIQIKS